MEHLPGHDRLTYDHPLPAGFQRTAMEAHLMRGRMLHGKAVQKGFGSLWRGIVHLFDFRVDLTPHQKAG